VIPIGGWWWAGRAGAQKIRKLKITGVSNVE
jgi:hypothetical protein